MRCFCAGLFRDVITEAKQSKRPEPFLVLVRQQAAAANGKATGVDSGASDVSSQSGGGAGVVSKKLNALEKEKRELQDRDGNNLNFDLIDAQTELLLNAAGNILTAAAPLLLTSTAEMTPLPELLAAALESLAALEDKTATIAALGKELSADFLSRDQTTRTAEVNSKRKAQEENSRDREPERSIDRGVMERLDVVSWVAAGGPVSAHGPAQPTSIKRVVNYWLRSDNEYDGASPLPYQPGQTKDVVGRYQITMAQALREFMKKLHYLHTFIFWDIFSVLLRYPVSMFLRLSTTYPGYCAKT